MAIIKKQELANLSDKDIDKKIIELNNELIKAKGLSASKSAPDNPGKIKEIRRVIARMLTIKKLRGTK